MSIEIVRHDGSFRRFFAAFLAYVFLFDFILAYAIYTAMFELRGLTVTEIGILLAFWSAAAIVLELPSGSLADRFDRRWLLVAAPLLKTLTFVTWTLADGNFWLYGLGFLFWSLGQSLFSGTKEAMLYQRLESIGAEQSYDRLLGRERAANEMGIGLGALLGGFVAFADIDATLWLSLPPLLLGAAVALTLRDIRGTDTEAEERPSYVQNFRNALAEFRDYPTIRYLTVYTAVGIIVLDILEEFDQLYYLAVNLPIWAFGIADFLVLAAIAGASLIAHRLSRFRAIGWLLPLLSGLLLVVASLSAAIIMVVPLVLAYVIGAPASVLADAKFQASLEGRSRATATSALEVALNVSGIVLTLAFGALADAIGILPGYGWAGAWLVGFSLWVLWRQRAGFSIADRATDREPAPR